MQNSIKFWWLPVILLFSACGNDDKSIHPQVRNITESVYASLTVEPKDVYNVYSAAPGILDTLFVEEGDLVQHGQLLAQVVAQNPRLNTSRAQLNVQLAEEKYHGSANLLKNIEKDIEIAAQQFQLDSLNYQRQKNLWEQNIGSKNEFELRKLQYERSRNNLAALRQHYDQTKLELETNYQQSQNALAQAQTQLSDYSVTSKMDGRVYSVEKEAGEMILQQETLARIGAADEFVIEMAIDEVDVARVSVGLQAIITLDAYPDQTFSAEITKIYPQKNVRTQTFKVEGVFTEPPTMLYSGMSGEANIIIHQKQNTLTIPIEYFANGKVMTENGEVEVETGIQTMQQIEIISGIDSTTVLHKP